MIPTYNQAGYLARAIESALQQSYRPLNVVVGDDCSSDDTEEVVRAYKDVRLTYVRHKKNMGRTANYRTILREHATGDYVINLDGDDYYTDFEFISKAVKLTEQHSGVVIVQAGIRFQSVSYTRNAKLPVEDILEGRDVLRSLPRERYHFKHMGCLYHRQTAIDIDFYRKDSINSDWESLYRLALHGRVAYLHETVGTWRIHGGNASTTRDATQLLEALEIWESLFKGSISRGVTKHAAVWLKIKCLHYFSRRSLAAASRVGNTNLWRYIHGMLKAHGLPAGVLALSPIWLGTAVLAFGGLYRITEQIKLRQRRDA